MPLESDDTNFLQKLKAQIPAFLYYLQHRALYSTKESRMWFNPTLIHTDALERIMQCNRNHTEIDLRVIAQHYGMSESGQGFIYTTRPAAIAFD